MLLLQISSVNVIMLNCYYGAKRNRWQASLVFIKYTNISHWYTMLRPYKHVRVNKNTTILFAVSWNSAWGCFGDTSFGDKCRLPYWMAYIMIPSFDRFIAPLGEIGHCIIPHNLWYLHVPFSLFLLLIWLPCYACHLPALFTAPYNNVVTALYALGVVVESHRGVIPNHRRR